MKKKEQTNNLFYKLLGLFTIIHPGEALTAFLLTLNIFLLMTAYYIIKPVREALIIGEWSPEVKSYLSAVIAICLVFVVKIFSSLASRVPRQILISRITLFFISNLILFYILSRIGISSAAMGIIFFIWVGIFNLMVIAQFWGFANDVYSQEAGKRLFPFVAFGATFGGFSGSKIAGWIISPLGIYQMMLVVAGFLGLCIALTYIIHNREISQKKASFTQSDNEKKEVQSVLKPLEKGGGFQLLFKKKYLLYIAFLVLLLNFVNTNGEWILGKIAALSASTSLQAGQAAGMTKNQLIGQFYANFYSIMNLMAMFIQLFVVSRIFKWFGVGMALFVLPIITLGGYSFILAGAAVSLITSMKALENATDYSLMNTTKHSLFLITSREEKYKVKAAVDTFFHRSGDVFSGLFILLGTMFFSLTIKTAAAFNLILIVFWIILSILLAKEYKKLQSSKKL